MENSRGWLRAILKIVRAEGIPQKAGVFPYNGGPVTGLCWGLCSEHTQLPESLAALAWDPGPSVDIGNSSGIG